jgi:FeS assembly SUF system regulator
MIRMSKETDYAILLLTRFAAVPGELVFSARELAEATKVPLPTASKVLKSLTKGGLLYSQRGAKGGYTLSRRASSVTIVDVITAMEGALALTECLDQPGDCRQEPTCRMRENWEIINARVLSALEEITLEDLSDAWDSRLVVLDLDDVRPS